MRFRIKSIEEVTQAHVDEAARKRRWSLSFLVMPRKIEGNWVWLEIVHKRTLYYASCYRGGWDSGDWYPFLKKGCLTSETKFNEDETALDYNHKVVEYKVRSAE